MKRIKPTITKEINRSKGASKAPRKTPQRRMKYSLLTILLLVFICQLTWGVVINSIKAYSLRVKIAKLEQINKTAQKKNQYLREEIEKYNSNAGVEALARDRLLFSKDDETLVIIKNGKEESEE